MRVVLVGAGAVGSLLGWALASSGAEVSILRRPGSMAGSTPVTMSGSAPRRPSGPDPHELVIVDPAGVRRSAPVSSIGAPSGSAGQPDLIIVAVKTFDLPAALTALAPWPSSPVLTVQNGIGAEELAIEVRGAGPLLAGSVTASVERDAGGVVRCLRRGGIGLAVVQGDVTALRDDLVARFRRAGLPSRALPDWRAMKWSKLLANLVGNATSAILDEDPAAIYADPTFYRVERAQLQEALAVMAAQGLHPVSLPSAPVPWLARGVALPAPVGRPLLARTVGGARGGKSPSLRLHLASGSGGPSEIDQLNGAVVAAGTRHGVATPVNAALVAAFRDVASDPSRRGWYRADPAALSGRV